MKTLKLLLLTLLIFSSCKKDIIEPPVTPIDNGNQNEFRLIVRTDSTGGNSYYPYTRRVQVNLVTTTGNTQMLDTTLTVYQGTTSFPGYVYANHTFEFPFNIDTNVTGYYINVSNKYGSSNEYGMIGFVRLYRGTQIIQEEISNPPYSVTYFSDYDL